MHSDYLCKRVPLSKNSSKIRTKVIKNLSTQMKKQKCRNWVLPQALAQVNCKISCLNNFLFLLQVREALEKEWEEDESDNDNDEEDDDDDDDDNDDGYAEDEGTNQRLVRMNSEV